MFTENKTTELKREYVDDIKNTAIAFANCDGGTLYVGIEDDGSVRGKEKRSGFAQVFFLLFPILVGAAAAYLLGVR